MMCGLDREKFDAVIFTGYHAWAGCSGNPLSHTMNRRNTGVRLNGIPCSEFLLNSYTAGYFGVPVVMVTGDSELCAFAKEFMPAITTVPVSEGLGNGSTSLHPDEAVERIEAAAARAVKNAADCFVPMPEHFQMEIDFVSHAAAYSRHFYPGATLKGDSTVCFEHDDWYEMLRFCHFVLSNA
jgi:D-amino peptidase